MGGDNDGEPPLQFAVRSADTGLVRALLRGRALPNVGDSLGETALMEAAASGSAELCEILLCSRADIGSQANLTAICETLLCSRADISGGSQANMTAIDFAEDRPTVHRRAETN